MPRAPSPGTPKLDYSKMMGGTPKKNVQSIDDFDEIEDDY